MLKWARWEKRGKEKLKRQKGKIRPTKLLAVESNGEEFI